jgi:membrane fusion protein, multidrug efflux system
MNDTTDPLAERRRRVLTVLLLAFALLGALWWAYAHFILSQRERTDDAYVAGNQVVVSAQVAGTVVSVSAVNTALVEAGQELLRLDPVDAETQLSRAAAQLAAAVRQFRQQQALARQYDAQVRQRQLELERARQDEARRRPLAEGNAISGEELRHAREAVEVAGQALAQAQRQAESARALVEGITLADSPAVLEAKARYREAWVSARRHVVVAPVRGHVAQRSVQPGQRVAAGQPLLQVIPLEQVWVDANFKEGQLRNLRIGQPAVVHSDLYGSAVEYRGTVIGLAAGTGSAFSLLPPQNASGNWIKVVQRVPVKIALKADDLAASPLRIGLSLTATIDTHDRSGSVLASSPAVVGQEARAAAIDASAAEAEANALIAQHAGDAG